MHYVGDELYQYSDNNLSGAETTIWQENSVKPMVTDALAP